MTVYGVYGFKPSRLKLNVLFSILLFLRFAWVTLITKLFQVSLRDLLSPYLTLYPWSTPLIWYLSTGFSWNVRAEAVECWTLRFLGGSLGAVIKRKTKSKETLIEWKLKVVERPTVVRKRHRFDSCWENSELFSQVASLCHGPKQLSVEHSGFFEVHSELWEQKSSDVFGLLRTFPEDMTVVSRWYGFWIEVFKMRKLKSKDSGELNFVFFCLLSHFHVYVTILLSFSYSKPEYLFCFTYKIIKYTGTVNSL